MGTLLILRGFCPRFENLRKSRVNATEFRGKSVFVLISHARRGSKADRVGPVARLVVWSVTGYLTPYPLEIG